MISFDERQYRLYFGLSRLLKKATPTFSRFLSKETAEQLKTLPGKTTRRKQKTAKNCAIFTIITGLFHEARQRRGMPGFSMESGRSEFYENT
jgi:hypothetical protein